MAIAFIANITTSKKGKHLWLGIFLIAVIGSGIYEFNKRQELQDTIAKAEKTHKIERAEDKGEIDNLNTILLDVITATSSPAYLETKEQTKKMDIIINILENQCKNTKDKTIELNQ